MQFMDRGEFLKLSGFIGALAAFSVCQIIANRELNTEFVNFAPSKLSESESSGHACTPIRPRDLPGETV